MTTNSHSEYISDCIIQRLISEITIRDYINELTKKIEAKLIENLSPYLTTILNYQIDRNFSLKNQIEAKQQIGGRVTYAERWWQRVSDTSETPGYEVDRSLEILIHIL